MDKLMRVSVSWLGHPDVTVDSIEAARRVVSEAYCPGAVFGEFDARGEGDDYGKPLRWERMSWRRPDTLPGKYDGAIVCVYEIPEAKKPPRSIADLAKEALAVQDACNLVAVLHGYARSLGELRVIVGDWDLADKHPITLLWADKVAHLTGTQYERGLIMAAYRAADDLVKA